MYRTCFVYVCVDHNIARWECSVPFTALLSVGDIALPKPLPQIDESKLDADELKNRKEIEAAHESHKSQALVYAAYCVDGLLYRSLKDVHNSAIRSQIIDQFVAAAYEVALERRAHN